MDGALSRLPGLVEPAINIEHCCASCWEALQLLSTFRCE